MNSSRSIVRRLVAAVSCAVPLVGLASGTRLPVEDFRVLMVQAIDSPSGSAAGVLTGEMAATISAQFDARAPILVDVTTLRRYRQRGCARLNVRFSQDGVMLPGATAPRTETLDLGINYCRDGKPPRSLS